MGFHISSPFYTKELRQLIKQLKTEGRLNERPLWELDKDFLRKFLILMLIPMLIFFTKPEDYVIAFCFLFFAILIPVWLVRDTIGRFILPCTKRDTAYVRILSEPFSHLQGMDPKTRFLSFDYMFIDEGYPERKMSYKLKNFSSMYMGDKKVSSGESVEFILNKRAIKKSFPLTETVMKYWCLDTEKLGR